MRWRCSRCGEEHEGLPLDWAYDSPVYWDGPRAEGGLLDGWLVDTSDEGTQIPGVRTRAVPLWMRDEETTARMVADALELAR